MRSITLHPPPLDEALTLIAGGAKPLSGGMSLIPDDEASACRAGALTIRPPEGTELHREENGESTLARSSTHSR